MTPHEARKNDPRIEKLSDDELTEALRLLEDLVELALKDYFAEAAAKSKQERRPNV